MNTTQLAIAARMSRGRPEADLQTEPGGLIERPTAAFAEAIVMEVRAMTISEAREQRRRPGD
jgi:hypothetical protein